MIDAVARLHGGERDDLFGINPNGVQGTEDFSFLVIGDPGEGDASQYSLMSRYLELGRHPAVKFLVVSSDVIYPAGSMHDYEANFYLPFQGFAKEIYAIPGNHDWYDALEGFNANFLEPAAARAAIAARVEADLGLTGTNARRIDRLMAEAARLRGLYRINVGVQRAPFFEMQTEDFALLAIDTGILRTVDKREWAWIERALERSKGKFTMAIVGHPRLAGGRDIPEFAEGHDVSDSAATFSALYQLLASHNVRIAMAGDTHDFEYYREKVSADGATRVMHHFVNGGGGAYLSIGTALDFRCIPPSRIGRSIPGLTSFARRWMQRCQYGNNRSGIGSSGSKRGRSASRPCPACLILTTPPFCKASWRCGLNGPQGGWFSFSTASMAP
jgi:hypothetical protein